MTLIQKKWSKPVRWLNLHSLIVYRGSRASVKSSVRRADRVTFEETTVRKYPADYGAGGRAGLLIAGRHDPEVSGTSGGRTLQR